MGVLIDHGPVVPGSLDITEHPFIKQTLRSPENTVGGKGNAIDGRQDFARFLDILLVKRGREIRHHVVGVGTGKQIDDVGLNQLGDPRIKGRAIDPEGPLIGINTRPLDRRSKGRGDVQIQGLRKHLMSENHPVIASPILVIDQALGGASGLIGLIAVHQHRDLGPGGMIAPGDPVHQHAAGTGETGLSGKIVFRDVVIHDRIANIAAATDIPGPGTSVHTSVTGAIAGGEDLEVQVAGNPIPTNVGEGLAADR